MSHPGADSGPRFDLGHTIITAEALDVLSDTDVQFALLRHRSGDWGELEESDAARNDVAASTEGRIVSVYESKTHQRFYVITEADRSVTTILLPHEY
jgi:hypothetical protein